MNNADQIVEIHFPVAGVDVSRAFGDQAPNPLPQGEEEEGAPYGRTCAVGKNVRAFEASTLRRRGGTRPGLVKYIPEAVGDIPGWLVQELTAIVINDGSAEL